MSSIMLSNMHEVTKGGLKMSNRSLPVMVVTISQDLLHKFKRKMKLVTTEYSPEKVSYQSLCGKK